MTTRERRGEAADPPPVRAAGGVVWRRTPAGPMLLLVHRPGHDDWTFPKGKRDPGETDEACALREIEEETGLRCELGAELATIAYTDAEGRPKTVRYWLARRLGGRARPRNEVDGIRWVTPAEAARLLTYPRDRALALSSQARLRAAGPPGSRPSR